MYLKTLELQGFKSFPDKTVIEFDKGMTAIVGANGSGKSNISDAVRWVLGEMSAKSLRGSKMEDVIFNGSGKRRPANFAEVIMTIDNSDYLMKIDYDEVSVGRRLYRSGESEYFLNQKQVRLKDVVDLFLNTGIGREGYSVISQGKIAEIISLKGNERRELFEEAAGITRFRYRKHEATVKLASVSENAVRINDILSEVQSRLPGLESQAEKAEKYLAIAGEKRKLELGVWAGRMKTLADQIAAGRVEYAAEDKALIELTDTIEGQDHAIDALYVETQEKNVESEKKRAEVSRLAGEDSDLAARLSVLENEIHHIDVRHAETEEESGRNADRRAAAEESRAEAETFLAAIQAEMDEVEKTLEENLAAQKELADRYIAAGEREEAILTQKDALEEEIREAQMRLKEEEGFGKAREERAETIRASLAGAEADRKSAKERFAALEAELQKAEEAKKAADEENGRINLELYHLGESIENQSDVLQREKLKKLESEQRRETLTRMERLLEGFSDSVREIMAAAGDGELKGICGPVSRVISTDEKYVLAIETALAGAIQHVVTEDEDSARDAIRFLKENKLGRATFLPLTTIRPARYRDDHIRARGYLGVASDLCRSEETYQSVVEYLLGKTLVCENLQDAIDLARSEKFGVKIVTLDGQVIHAGGAFSGGQAQHKSGTLSRAGDIARLGDEIAAGEKKIASLQEKLDEAEARRRELRDQLKEIEQKLEILNAAAASRRNEVQLEGERLSRGDESFKEMEAELAGLTEALSRREEESEARQRAMEALQEKCRALDEELDKIASEEAELEEKREKEIIRQGEINTLRAQAQLRLESAADKLNQVQRVLDQIDEGEAKKAAAEEALSRQREEALAEIEASKIRRAELSRLIEEENAAIAALQERVREAGEESGRIRQEQRALIAEKEKRMEAFSRLAGKLNGAERETDNIRRQLFEEYELEETSEEFVSAAATDVAAMGGEKRLSELRGQIRRIGPVNLDSVQELAETKARFEFLNTQYADIIQSKEELEHLIADLEGTMRDMFAATFEEVRLAFRQIFTELFGGGSADIELTNKEDILNCGVEIRVQPPGKLIKNLSLLSGGEQAFVAIALYMSLLRINPSPFCIFDEIESALDESNVRRFATYLHAHNDKTQFIVITHRRGTMEEADTLYGITMQEKGVSDFIRLDAGSIGNYTTDKE